MKSIRVLVLGLAMLALTAFGGLASAAEFEHGFKAEKYPATLTGGGGAGLYITTSQGKYLCELPKISGGLAKESSQLTTTAADAPCGGFGTLHPNGCEFIFHPEGASKVGTFDIGGKSCSSTGMTFFETSWNCLKSLPPQSGRSATFYNVGTGAGAKISIQVKTSVKAKAIGGENPACFESTSFQMEGPWELKGSSGGAATGVSIF